MQYHKTMPLPFLPLTGLLPECLSHLPKLLPVYSLYFGHFYTPFLPSPLPAVSDYNLPVQVPLLPASGVWLQIPPWHLCFRQVLLPLQMHNRNFFVFLPGKPVQDSARSVPGLLPVAAFSPPDALLGLLSQPFPPLCALRHLPLRSGYI